MLTKRGALQVNGLCGIRWMASCTHFRRMIAIVLFLVIASLPTNLHASNTVDGAIQWAQAQGIADNWDADCGHVWAGWCLHFVGHCYLATGTYWGYGCALDAWNANDSTFGPRSTGPAPRGALVFYNISLPYGHVGLSCGDGTMWNATTEGGTHEGVQHDNISRYGSLLGWRMPNAWIAGGTPPTIGSVNPAQPTGSSSPQPFTIYGSNFVSGCNVTLRVGGSTYANRPINSFSSTAITINPIFTTVAQTWTVEVTNPDEQSSGQFSFSVIAPTPGSRRGVDYMLSRPSPTQLRSLGYDFVIRYVSPYPNPPSMKNITAAEAQALQAAGLDIILVFESYEGRITGGYAAGVEDANTAVTVATGAGAPPDFFCYFACDFDAPASDQTAINAYLDGAASVLGGVSRVGFYGGYWQLSRVLDAGKASKGWQAAGWSYGNQDPRISLLQHYPPENIAGGLCDVDDGFGDDLGQWSAVTPPVAPIINSIPDATISTTAYTGPTPTLSQGTEPVTWSLVANPSGMTINASGVVSWPSPTATGSPHTVTIRATNSAGFDDETWLLTVSPTVNSSIEITGNGQTIPNGSTSYDINNNTDFSHVYVGEEQALRNFRIYNRGTGTLLLTGSPAVQLSGSSCFSVDTPPATTSIAESGYTNYLIRFNPTTAGFHYATVSVQSNDASIPTYTYSIRGEGWNHTLTVKSTGTSPVNISSFTGHDGTTEYTVAVPSGTTAQLTAPSTANGYSFDRWDGADSVVGNTAYVTVTTSDRTIYARYLAPPPPSKATNPSPANGDMEQSINTDMSWSDGGGATSYDVYFGTSNPPASQGNQAGTTYNPGTLAYSTTYYWRIDAKNSFGTTTGDVWSFTTEAPQPPSKATNPFPANGATNVPVTTDLGWQNGGGATSYDVWLGTSNPPMALVSEGQPGTSYTPGTLAASTTYYWRIDARNSPWNPPGDVWSFTTAAAPTYTLTYTAGPGGSISGTTPQTVDYGANGTAVTATPAAHYHFVSWSDGYPTASRTDMNVTANVSATANFAIDTFTLTYTAGPNGSIMGTTPQTVSYGANGTAVIATPAGNYHFLSWNDGLLTASRTDRGVTADIAVTASFAPDPALTVNLAGGGSGRVTKTPNLASYPVGTTVTLYAWPDPGSYLAGWSGDIATTTALSVLVTMDVDKTVMATFDMAPVGTHTLSVATTGTGGGAVTKSPDLPYYATGTIVTLLATPNFDSLFAGWSGDTTGTASSVMVTMDANKVTTATFNIKAFVLTYVAGSNGSISGLTTQTVTYGGNGTPVMAVPAAHYHFVSWSDGYPTASRTDMNVTANVSATANFAIDTFTLSYTAGTNGSIVGTTPQTVDYGANGPAVTATPAAHYHFVSWSDGYPTASRTDMNVTANVSATANFAIDTVTLTYVAGPNGSIIGPSPQAINYGGNGTAVTPTPFFGYHFVNWSDGLTDNPRTDSNVTTDTTVMATFAVTDPTFYKVTYRGCNIATTDLLTSGILSVVSRSYTASVKIQKVKNPNPGMMLDMFGKVLYLKNCPTEIPEVSVTGGGLGTFYTDAPVFLLRVAGRLGKLSTKDAVITDVVTSSSIGSLKMASLTPGKETSVVSGGNVEDSLTAGFSGVCVAGLRTQQKVKKLSVASKKTRAWGVVQGKIGDSADLTTTVLVAPSFGKIFATSGVHAKIVAGTDAANDSPNYSGFIAAIATGPTGTISGEAFVREDTIKFTPPAGDPRNTMQVWTQAAPKP